MRTITIETKLKMVINFEEAEPDENSIKAGINEGMRAMTDAPYQCIDSVGSPVASVCVAITDLKVRGKKVKLDDYGTSDVPWGDA